MAIAAVYDHTGMLIKSLAASVLSTAMAVLPLPGTSRNPDGTRRNSTRPSHPPRAPHLSCRSTPCPSTAGCWARPPRRMFWAVQPVRETTTATNAAAAASRLGCRRDDQWRGPLAVCVRAVGPPSVMAAGRLLQCPSLHPTGRSSAYVIERERAPRVALP